MLKNTQHGFRSHRSCTTNLLEYLESITSAIDEGENVDSIYLDFSKAFDKVPHKRLMLKLKSFGIDGKLLKWISEWLQGRMQRVVTSGCKSDWAKVLSGVPQGSVLGPLLFIMYINDLDDVVGCEVSKFADDTKIFQRICTDDARNTLQQDLNRLGEWSEKWQMKFNEDKCNVMHFGSSNPKKKYTLNDVDFIIII